MKKIVQGLMLLMIATAMIVLTGCGSDDLVPGHEFKNESSYTVTVRTADETFVLKPGQRKKMEIGYHYFTYEPERYVRWEDHDTWSVFHNR